MTPAASTAACGWIPPAGRGTTATGEPTKVAGTFPGKCQPPFSPFSGAEDAKDVARQADRVKTNGRITAMIAERVVWNGRNLEFLRLGRHRGVLNEASSLTRNNPSVTVEASPIIEWRG